LKAVERVNKQYDIKVDKNGVVLSNIEKTSSDKPSKEELEKEEIKTEDLKKE
jgi:hypothetical protein